MEASGINVVVVLTALLIDAAVGDPRWLYARVPHPVVVLGKLIELAERVLYVSTPRALSIACGALTVLLVVGGAAVVAWLLERLVLQHLSYGWLVEAMVASTLLAFRSLYDHVCDVADGLERSLTAGRDAVRHIVGRDCDSLDESGVARAAIESAAENFSDAVVVPVFWYLLGGLPALFAYKAINTLDSMIGHRSERYIDFGMVAARLDDIANYLPARLAGCYIVVAAWMVPHASAARAWRVMLRDAPKHRSPNAGWQQAAFAGALGMALAGPRRYAHGNVEVPWMGDGRSDAGADDIRRGLHLYLCAGALVALSLLFGWRLI